MGKLYTCLKKNYAHFNHFDIEQSIVQTSKNYTSLDFPAHKEYKNLFWCPQIKQNKVIGVYSGCSRNEVFYRDFLDETDFVSDYTDRYWDKTIP